MLLVLLGLFLCVHGELILECPDQWQPFADRCFKFVFYPKLVYDQAKADCSVHGASLIGVDTLDKHNFVSNWLMSYDLSREAWYTSGVVNNLETGDLVWESDGSVIAPDRQHWIDDSHRDKIGRNILYLYGVTRYGWSRTQGNAPHSYVCEIPLDEVYRILQEQRDFGYGTNITDPNDVPRGPKLITEPHDLVEIGTAGTAIIECVAIAIPPPSYRLYHTYDNGTVIRVTTGDRLAITNGKLIIQDPRENPDGGKYHCEAENQFGIVRSRQMQLSFGFLGEFSNVVREPVRANLYYSAVIDCNPPNNKPALSYSWLKGASNNIIRTDINPHLFISDNGKLYFSETARTDETYYKCLIKLISDNGAAIGSNQPPTRVSLPVDLELNDATPANWGPEIGNEFVTVFPRSPKRGQNIRMECLAYGTLPIIYSWTRAGGLPMPTTAKLHDHNRVLYIYEVQLEDSGTYTCHASRATSAQTEKPFYLSIQAAPYFIYPLRDQHTDIGSKLTWRCDARAQPAPTISWLKNGKPLVPVSGDVSISGNILTIQSLQPDQHSGMYQCAATNEFGTTYSGAQLRVLAFKPSFVKHPLEPSILGTVGGNVTIICSPEAAPAPSYSWSKNGADLGLADGDTSSRIRKLKNGNLFISPAQMGDAGIYTCTADNVYGSDASSGELTIMTGITITNPPANTEVVVNSTAFIMCEASHPPDVDMVYDWRFQDRSIDSKDPHFIMNRDGMLKGLFVVTAQPRHTGFYQCYAKSSFEMIYGEARLTVLGPPGEPSGVFVETAHTTSVSMVVWWTVGPNNGGNIAAYIIEVSTDGDTEWHVHREGIPAHETVVEGRTKRRYLVEDLKPGNGYKFRLRASNMYGIGPPSTPSDIYQTPPAAPVTAPEGLTGGGGKVGDLTIVWQPMNSTNRAGPGFGYNLYYRLLNTERWIKVVLQADASQHVIFVGQETFYSLYEIKIQGFNDKGQGPNSTVVAIYSAEDMPIGVPTEVYAYQHNSTAMNVTWVMVEDSREVMKGVIWGYQVNYVLEGEDSGHALHAVAFPGQRTWGLVIGLEPFSWYIFDTHVLNSAGLGPVSETYRQQTWALAPLLHPTEVYIFSHSFDSVRITWRGVSTTVLEEPIMGYKIRYWVATDDIRTATDHMVSKVSEAVVTGVLPNFLYKLRVMGFSRGGDGKMSPDVYFTLGGQVQIDPETSEIRASSPSVHFSFVLLIFSSLLVHITHL